jgi:aquaporin related protein
MPTVMVTRRIITIDTPTSSAMLTQVSLNPNSTFSLDSPNVELGRHATDGADERDFATQLQAGTRQPARIQRQVLPFRNNPVGTLDNEKAVLPSPVPVHGLDGHRSDSLEPTIAGHHSCTLPTRGSSNYEISSDQSYRSGPSAESGSAKS